tara:strand:+ start:927 stop:1520 length:594 start_codon:yes stop_codon:yes gene_type:complete
MFPIELVEVVEYLNTLTIAVSENHEDGRVNSIDDEDTIIDLLVEKYGDNIEKPKARCWWDVKIFGHPLNIKSSNFKSGDNFSSKLALLYALTDIPEGEIKANSWKSFQEKLKEHKGENNRDYYIIVLSKLDGKVYLQSLKSLRKINSNGNNLPFQVNWGNNTEPVERTYLQAYNFLIECYKESVRKKITSHDGFEEL